jgi:hypothetical protein
LHFQFPPTKNLRASSLAEELKALFCNSCDDLNH